MAIDRLATDFRLCRRTPGRTEDHVVIRGAAEGLRNPRAHALIKDDPERALKFIALCNFAREACGVTSNGHNQRETEPMSHSDAEVDVLFRTSESDLVERKRSTNLKAEILETICAFANDLPDYQKEGLIFIGVEDDGKCANLTITEKTVREVANWRNEGKVQPIPTISVTTRIIDGCPV